MNEKQFKRMQSGKGFIAALDQSGGSTPKALKAYGITEDMYDGEEAMFDMIHDMRCRIITAEAFASERILAAILFEMTMDRRIEGRYSGDYLWEEKGIVPFVKVDQGLAPIENGVQLMKPLTKLEGLLKRAKERSMFGTKMRSVIHEANAEGIKAAVRQQFEAAEIILNSGLVPIIEPEVSIRSPHKTEAEAILKQALLEGLETLPKDRQVMFKLTIPNKVNFYQDLIEHPRVLRVVALSGGYSRIEADALLKKQDGMIASFSRALVEDLRYQQSNEEFEAALDKSIQSIYEASL